MRKLFSFFPLLILCSGCGQGSDSGGGVTARARGIAGGTTPSGTHSFLLKLRFPGGECSGVLVTPEIVLTAKHCLSDAYGKLEPYVYAEGPALPSTLSQEIYVWPDGLDYGLPVDNVRRFKIDLGWVRLKSPAPAWQALDYGIGLEAALDANLPLAGETLGIAGYGLSDTPPAQAGILRIGATMVQTTDIALGFARISTRPTATHQAICRGDSGGALLRSDGPATAGRTKLVGISSGSNVDTCDGIHPTTYFISIAAYRDALLQVSRCHWSSRCAQVDPDNQASVASAFAYAIGREPTKAEKILNAGTDYAGVVNKLRDALSAPGGEYAAVLSRAYRLNFGRDPNSIEIDSWSGRRPLYLFYDLMQALPAFLGSANGSGERREIVHRVFREVLGRDATASELTARIQTGKVWNYSGLVDSLKAYLQSTAGAIESEQVIRRAFQFAYGAEPTAAEMSTYRSGYLSYGNVLVGLRSALMYFGGSQKRAAFIQLAYQRALGRNAGAKELAAWKALPQLWLYEEIRQNFIAWLARPEGSTERDQVVIRAYQQAFGRDPGSREIAAWNQAPSPVLYDDMVRRHVAWMGGGEGTAERRETILRAYRVTRGREATPSELAAAMRPPIATTFAGICLSLNPKLAAAQGRL